MKYMRDEKKIDINGSTEKKKLRYMGYYHGYKGYRYHFSPSNLYNFSSFTEIQAVYDYDMALKTMFYPEIMFLETALKNYVLEEVLETVNSKRFADVYAQVLTSYKKFHIGTDGYKKEIKKRMNVRNNIYKLISRDYEKRNVVKHYYDKDQPIPIWAIFELMSLGDFGSFISCTDENIKHKIASSIGIKKSFDTDGMMTQRIVYALKDLRNSVAHNNTIFDTRFKTGNIHNNISKYISSETGINNIKFDSIIDYVVLICFIMNLLECPKTRMNNILRAFENINETLRKQVPISIYNTIVHTDARNKIEKMKEYIKQ